MRLQKFKSDIGTGKFSNALVTVFYHYLTNLCNYLRNYYYLTNSQSHQGVDRHLKSLSVQTF